MEKSNEQQERKFGLYAALCYIAVFLIGVPVWWHTTAVYRVSLPHSEIDQFGNLPIPLTADVRLLGVDLGEDSSLLDTLRRQLASQLSFKKFHQRVHVYIHYNTTLSTTITSSSASNDVILEMYHNAQSIDEFDKSFQSVSNLPDSSIYLILLPQNSGLLFEKDLDVYFGANRAIYCRMQRCIDDTFALVKFVLMEVYFGGNILREIIDRALKERTRMTSSSAAAGNGNDVGNVASAVSDQAVSIQPRYSLDFILLHPDPDECKFRLDERSIINGYLKSFLTRLHPATSFRLSSQPLYYVDLPSPGPKYDKEGEFYYLESSYLPNIINRVQDRLLSNIGNETTLNYFVYVPPQRLYPFYILDDRGQKVKHNAFAIAGLGGLMVVNPVGAACNGSYSIHYREILPAILSLIRKDMGLSSAAFVVDLSTSQSHRRFAKSASPLADWELDRFKRLATVEYVLTSMTSLQSLTRLLAGISNIVINDETGAHIQAAVERLMHALRDEESFDGIVDAARQAFVNSERAFFDQSLLALLYFPADQKYAVYVPLFLPAGLPIVLSIFAIFKYYKKKSEKVEVDGQSG